MSVPSTSHRSSRGHREWPLREVAEESPRLLHEAPHLLMTRAKQSRSSCTNPDSTPRHIEHRARERAKSLTWLLSCFLLVGGLILGASPAAAQSGGNLCIKEKIGGNPPCTAYDVRVGKLEVVGTCDGGSQNGQECIADDASDPCISGGGTCVAIEECVEGDDIEVMLQATIESGPDRWAIGLWLRSPSS